LAPARLARPAPGRRSYRPTRSGPDQGRETTLFLQFGLARNSPPDTWRTLFGDTGGLLCLVPPQGRMHDSPRREWPADGSAIRFHGTRCVAASGAAPLRAPERVSGRTALSFRSRARLARARAPNVLLIALSRIARGRAIWTHVVAAGRPATRPRSGRRRRERVCLLRVRPGRPLPLGDLRAAVLRHDDQLRRPRGAGRARAHAFGGVGLERAAVRSHQRLVHPRLRDRLPGRGMVHRSGGHARWLWRVPDGVVAGGRRARAGQIGGRFQPRALRAGPGGIAELPVGGGDRLGVVP